MGLGRLVGLSVLIFLLFSLSTSPVRAGVFEAIGSTVDDMVDAIIGIIGSLADALSSVIPFYIGGERCYTPGEQREEIQPDGRCIVFECKESRPDYYVWSAIRICSPTPTTTTTPPPTTTYPPTTTHPPTTTTSTTYPTTTTLPTTTTTAPLTCADYGFADTCIMTERCEPVQVSPALSCCVCVPLVTTTVPVTTTMPGATTTTLPTGEKKSFSEAVRDFFYSILNALGLCFKDAGGWKCLWD